MLYTINFENEIWNIHKYKYIYIHTYSPWNSLGQNTGVGCLSFLLQGIFPIQGSNPGLLHCRRILYQLSHQGSPRVLEWVAYPFSSGSFRPRNRNSFSCTAGGFFTSLATRAAHTVTCKHLCLCLLFPHWYIHLSRVSLFKTCRYIFPSYTFKIIYLYPLFSLLQDNGMGKQQRSLPL